MAGTSDGKAILYSYSSGSLLENKSFPVSGAIKSVRISS